MRKDLDDVATGIRAGYKRLVDDLPTAGQPIDLARANVAIVGGGFAGLATAWSLLRSGVRDVVVLHGDAQLGSRASGRNAGLGRQLYESDEITALAVQGVAWLRDHPAFTATGSWLTFDDELRMSAYHARAQRNGVRCRVVASDEVARMWPAWQVATTARHALHLPDDGLIDPIALVGFYADEIRALGGRIVVDATVHGVTHDGTATPIVHSARGDVRATIVVDAAGAWATPVAARLGGTTPTLTPIKRHIAITSDAAFRPSQPNAPFVWHLGNGDDEFYLRTHHGDIMLSACDARATDPDDDAVDAHIDAMLRARFATHASPWSRMWACHRTFSDDGRLVIAADLQQPWLALVAGLGSHGATVSSVVGQRAAALVTAMLASR